MKRGEGDLSRIFVKQESPMHRHHKEQQCDEQTSSRGKHLKKAKAQSQKIKQIKVFIFKSYKQRHVVNPKGKGIFPN